MSESVQREWRFYLDDMIRFGEVVLVLTALECPLAYYTQKRKTAQY